MSCESIGRHPCSLRLVLSVQQIPIRRYPVSRDVETTICFLLVFLPVSARDSVPASAIGSVVPSLRETVSLWPLREAVFV